MGNGQEPLDQGQPAIEPAPRVRVGIVQVDGLLLVGRGVAVIHQRQVHADTVREPLQLQVPVEPPAGVLLAEHDHEERSQEQQPNRPGAAGHRVVVGRPVPGASRNRAEQHEDRQRHDQAKECGGAIERPGRIGDGEANGVRGGVHGVSFV